MQDITPHCTLLFLTDGDAVAEDQSGKFVWLMQGADERVAGPGKALAPNPYPPILFTGMVNHGLKRRSHVEHLKERWGERFLVMGDGGPRYRKHGRELADVFASVKVVVAPDGPSTDCYWSNRVYLTLGLGGFLLHPFCKGLRDQYQDYELVMYHDRDELDDMIECFLMRKSPATGVDFDESRELHREAGLKVTMERHLYRHRVEELLRIVKERT